MSNIKVNIFGSSCFLMHKYIMRSLLFLSSLLSFICFLHFYLVFFVKKPQFKFYIQNVLVILVFLSIIVNLKFGSDKMLLSSEFNFWRSVWTHLALAGFDAPLLACLFSYNYERSWTWLRSLGRIRKAAKASSVTKSFFLISSNIHPHF